MSKLSHREILDSILWHGCFTGDCPHSTQAECNAAIFELIAPIAREAEVPVALAPSEWRDKLYAVVGAHHPVIADNAFDLFEAFLAEVDSLVTEVTRLRSRGKPV